MRRCFALLLATGLSSGGLAAQELEVVSDSLRMVADTAPLFASHDVLELRLEAPLKTVLRDRSQESEYHPGKLFYVDGRGDSVEFDVRVKTRGKFRLQRRICGFPNLHINFRRSQVANTIFAGQNRLSIVAHCQDNRSEYEQHTLQEYLLYRTYNLLTDTSVRVRLARITYIDTEGDRDPITRYMFFLENFDMLAARHGWEEIEVPLVPPDQQDAHHLLLIEVFQFMILNSDWSIFRAAEGESCCHNMKMVGTMIEVTPVPYDFDWSGVIAAPYAKPDPRLGIRSVRQRRYWGICRPAEEFTAIFPVFNERRDAIYELWRSQEGLDPKRLERALEDFDDFYEIINDRGKVGREILRECRR